RNPFTQPLPPATRRATVRGDDRAGAREVQSPGRGRATAPGPERSRREACTMNRIAAVALVLAIGAVLALLPMTAQAAGNADPATPRPPQTLCYNYATGTYFVCSYAYSWPYGSSYYAYSPYYSYANTAYHYGVSNPYYTGYYYTPTYYGTYTPYYYAG